MPTGGDQEDLFTPTFSSSRLTCVTQPHLLMDPAVVIIV